MAFAPKGSRPKVEDLKEKPIHKPRDDTRQPTLIGAGFVNEALKARERVTRKPPVPRGISVPKAVPQRPPKEVTVASSARRIVTASRTGPLPPRAKPPVSRTTNAPVKTARSTITKNPTSSKPGLPPRLKPAGAQVAPDALTITAQLAPWLFMRTSLEEPLQKLEIETENVLKEQKAEVSQMERHFEENRRRTELLEQNEMLEDLCNEQNSTFASSILYLTRDISSFISLDNNTTSTSHLMAKFEALQDKVHSVDVDLEVYSLISKELDEAIQRGQSIKSTLDDVVSRTASLQPKLSPHLRCPSRWNTLLERYTALLTSRLQNLEELAAAVPLIEAYQRRKIELEVLKMALA